MSFLNIKKYFLQKNFNRLLKEQVANGSNKKIQTIGVIIDDEISSKLAVQKIIEEVLEVGNVKMYHFKSKAKKQDRSYDSFSEKDFSWHGKIKNINLQEFLNEPFDLLIGYFDKPNMFLETAVLQSKATFKVGFAGFNASLFDIVVSSVGLFQIEEYLKEIKKYLVILKKLKN